MRFNVESWIWFTLAVGIILARLISRTLLFGSPFRLQYDDFIMGLFITTCYTALIVTSNVEIKTHSNLLRPGFDITTLTPQEIVDRQNGSKIVIVVEQMQIAVIWGCKSCLLILYYRLTESVAPKSFLAVKLLAAYVSLGLLVMEILYFASWCRPFSSYWAVPVNSPQCNALTNHRITNAIFNISSDLIMLGIALTLFIRSMLPLKRKLVLCGIFSLGIFAILAAVLNKYYSFSNPYKPDWVFWYVREASTAVLVANLPFTWTLLRRVFNLGAFDPGQAVSQPKYHSSRTAGGRRTARVHHAQLKGSLNGKHSNSRGSRGSQPASHLVSAGSWHGDHNENSSGPLKTKRNHAADATAQQHDFALVAADIDMEQGLCDFHHPIYSAYRPSTPPPHLRTSKVTPKPSPDGTGGFITRPSPGNVSLHPDHHLPGSSASSQPSTFHRPTFSMPSYTGSVVSDGVSDAERGIGDCGSGGISRSNTKWGRGVAAGARSAVDRKKRARVSSEKDGTYMRN